MTIKEAILKSLDEIGQLASSTEICEDILKKNYFEFNAKTPSATISSKLGEFIRNGDTRVKRIKQSNGTYLYYLTKNESYIGIDVLTGMTKSLLLKEDKITYNKNKTFHERHLHKLLCTYLKSTDVYSKTIFHEQSNSKDNNQIWTHPDMVGIKFLNLQSKTSQNFLNVINRVETFKLSSYELKKEINSDAELKKAYFQAVSNSSWANYGYLVAFEINDSLDDEMARLNQSFGIGIIQLNSNPYQSKVLYQSKYKDLDFSTIDKLCKINKDFEKFLEQTEKLLTANERYHKAMEKELDEFCDDYFQNDTEIEDYCRKNFIPVESEG